MVGTSCLSTCSIVHRMKTSESGQNGPANLHVRSGRGVAVVAALGRASFLSQTLLSDPGRMGFPRGASSFGVSSGLVQSPCATA